MATIKQYKLNPVVEPFTEEQYNDDNFGGGYYDYEYEPVEDMWFGWAVEYSCSTDNNGNFIKPLGWQITIYKAIDDYTKYVYVYEPTSYGVDNIGWYKEDVNQSGSYLPVDINDVKISLRFDDQQPEDWNVVIDGESIEWEAPWIGSAFYKVLTEIVEEPKEPIEITYKIKRSTLVDIANAIREKTGKTDLIKVIDLDDAVKELSAGGGGGSSDSSITLNDVLEGEW